MSSRQQPEVMGSWPESTNRNGRGELVIGGVSCVDLAESFGTPLYVFDEVTLRGRARRIRNTFASAYPRSRIVYAAKAYLSPVLTSILTQEQIGLDVVSGGEIYAGFAGGALPEQMIFHGNNKSQDELAQALEVGVGLIAIDNDLEIELLAQVASKLGRHARVVLRLNPGVDPHTHEKMRTGATDSKFGFPVWDGQADRAARAVAASGWLRLVGYHAHVGSQIFDPLLVSRTIDAIMAFAAGVKQHLQIAPEVIIPGGGFGVADDASGADVPIDDWAHAAARAIREGSAALNVALPELIVEPGRAIVGPAGVALYRVGSRKVVPGVRTYVSVDGGMADNIRPSLYGAQYTAELASRDGVGSETEVVTISGKYCESGHVLISDIVLPCLEPGDILAVPMAGAYCLAMASNYNLAPRPAAVLLNDGQARLFRQRETYADMLRMEHIPGINEDDHAVRRLSLGEDSL